MSFRHCKNECVPCLRTLSLHTVRGVYMTDNIWPFQIKWLKGDLFWISLARFCINMYSHDIKLKIDICCVFCSLWFAPLCAFADMGASQTWALLHTGLILNWPMPVRPYRHRSPLSHSQLCGEKRGDSNHDALVGNFYLNNLQSNLVLVTYQNNWRSKPNWS